MEINVDRILFAMTTLEQKTRIWENKIREEVVGFCLRQTCGL